MHKWGLLLVVLAGLVGCQKDEDKDGIKADEDCDDLNAAAFPGADEVCDGADNNCDGVIDEDDALDALTWYADADSDGYGDLGSTTTACEQPEGYVADNSDCEDDFADAHPGGTEVCDDHDNDCDGTVDEDDATDASTWYVDADGDDHGVPGSTDVACDQPAGYAASSDDCDDDDITTYPGATEVCDDGYDNACEDDLIFDCDDSDCTGDTVCMPDLTDVSPPKAFVGFTSQVTLTGSGFDFLTAGTTTVSFTGVGACTGVTVVDATTVTCTTPAASAETLGVDVVLTNANGSATWSGFDFVEGGVYIATAGSLTAGELYYLDFDTSTPVLVGSLVDADGGTWTVTGLAFSPDGTLYGVTGQNDPAHLLIIDPATALVTDVGEMANSAGQVFYRNPDITFVGSTLIGWTEWNDTGGYDDPIVIDTDTATTEVLATSSVGSAGSGMAADAAGTVYFIPSGSTIYSVDPSTGAVTSTSVSASGWNGYKSNALTFHDGALLTVDSAGYSGSRYVSEIDPATGQVTPLFALPDWTDAIASPAP